ncbi:hypothetical protein P301_O21231 [Saccharomyces cerevisiae P301]|uniref:Putative uncharacterized protein YOR314W-A n=2 Tax=Saccharomyces cerevisiae TaxID=4932 RepID=YO14A_YEAST|nr:RecName: Full=Putative uncharacterized protein YOR314W-A [Saccharomyces cerevisiae S288C]EWG83379.1 hypothetical protein R008_O13471 [Saccharomyces cerevisiae R008]EWG88579.1 hypothetical protein P301_O21231 [Saccharomyces cerevisiae P301]EWG93253.1 hypothetical protein R103_O20936 [Saccharomyces cerevisiae R103]KZV08203.1 hypothetical protein WN66_06160 [Saccharomyces cerevisiae]CAY86594.1 EC1118_1O4_5534p [Saccharomyces cerevisiae EC1118]
MHAHFDRKILNFKPVTVNVIRYCLQFSFKAVTFLLI